MRTCWSTRVQHLPPQLAYRQSVLWIAIIACCGLATGTAALASESVPLMDFQLVLEAEQTQFMVGEPVYITVRLRNTGSAPADVFHVLDPRAGAIRVAIESPSIPRRVFLPLSLVDVEKGVRPLAAGQELSVAIPIFYGGLKWTFSHPGTYTVTAIYRHKDSARGQTLRSNPITLSFSEADGAGRLLMDASGPSEEAARFLLWQQGDHLHHGLDRLRNVVATFPESPLADYVQLALGHNLTIPFRDYSIGKTRRQDCEGASAHLQQVRDNRLPPYLRIQKSLDEARCLQKSGQSKQASELFAHARRLSQARAEYEPLFIQALRLEPALKTSQ